MKKNIFVFIFLLCCSSFIFAEQNKPEELKPVSTTEYAYGLEFYPKENVIFASYIAGDPLKPSASGSIAKYDEKLENILEKDFIIGLQSPRGITVYRDLLIIADLNQVKIFNLKNKKLIKNIEAGDVGKSLVTDVCTDGKRFLYACDMLGNKIIQIDLKNNFEETVVVKGAYLDFPTSIIYSWKKDKLIVGAFFNGRIYEVNIDNGDIKTLIKQTATQVNGLALSKDGSLYISAGTKGGFIYQYKNNQLKELDTTESMPGDIFLKNKILFVPVLYKGYFKKIKV